MLRHLALEHLVANRVAALYVDDTTVAFRDEEWGLDRAALLERVELLARIVRRAGEARSP